MDPEIPWEISITPESRRRPHWRFELPITNPIERNSTEPTPTPAPSLSEMDT
jgi:hypothetical protein